MQHTSIGFYLAKRLYGKANIDALALQNFEGDPTEPLALARNIYHRLCARLLSYENQRALFFVLVGLALLVTFLPSPYQGTEAKFFAIFEHMLLPLIVVPVVILLTTRMEKYSAHQNEAKAIIKRALMRSIPNDTPEDLQDVWRTSWISDGGVPVSADIAKTDATDTELYKRGTAWLHLILLSLLVGAAVPSMWFGIAALFYAYLVHKTFFSRAHHPMTKRSAEMAEGADSESAMFNRAGGTAWARSMEKARADQIDNAKRDKTDLIHLGSATGIFAGRGDLFAPNANLPMRLSANDLCTHLMSFGGTGSGKTSSVAKPILKQVGAIKDHGILVLDGKGALPSEVAQVIPEMRVVRPSEDVVSLTAGIEPSVLIQTIRKIVASGQEDGGAFFVDSAAQVLTASATICQHVGGKWWTLSKVVKVAIDGNLFQALIAELDEDDLKDDGRPDLLAAVDYLATEWATLEDKVKSNIKATIRSWLSKITSHPDMLKWANATADQETVDVTTPLKGGRVGLLVPEHRYGIAGAVTSAILKERLYSGLKDRADSGLTEGETPLLVLMDEAQELLVPSDATMAAIGRSLKLQLVCLTQTVEGVVAKLGALEANKLLAVFGNVIVLPAKGDDTPLFAEKRAGKIWSPTVSSTSGTISLRESVARELTVGVSAAANRQEAMANAPIIAKDEDQNILIPDALKGIFTVENESNQGSTTIAPSGIIEAGEIADLLAEPNTAIAVLNRGRVSRRDVIRLEPIYS